jgi:hypothetical protein
MTPEEANLITSLYDRLSQASQQPRDPEVERLIQSRTAMNPAAPYLLTQSTLVLQQAVTAAQGRIAELEKQLAQSTPQQGGFLSSLFGSPQPVAPARAAVPPPIPQQSAVAPAQGGGFMQSALSTAAGVAELFSSRVLKGF